MNNLNSLNLNAMPKELADLYFDLLIRNPNKVTHIISSLPPVDANINTKENIIRYAEILYFDLISFFVAEITSADLDLILKVHKAIFKSIDQKSQKFMYTWLKLSVKPDLCLALWERNYFPTYDERDIVLENLKNAIGSEVSIVSELTRVKSTSQKIALLKLLNTKQSNTPF